ncbi:PP2C family protein-serine/threonine phosphatase [Humidisolicoccus flavus]|uniref:PP2C family protein-serine/threonine phosphatase n=1 Tax=Humidisolicoccus flavus TaxID=3111414 RepID=UPI003252EA21
MTVKRRCTLEVEADIHEYRLSNASISVRWAAFTHTGLKRKLNEDTILARFPAFIVADGMGGHHAGDIASSIAIAAFDALPVNAIASDAAVQACVDAAFSTVVDRFIEERNVGNGERVGGTTLSGASVINVDEVPHWLIVNVGDSRTYVLEDGQLEQVSVDHSVVQELIEEGLLTTLEARSHPQRNVITKAIGAGTESLPDYWVLPVSRGQRLLVCTDGLSGEVDDAEIARLLRTNSEARDAAQALFDAAILGGARDNLSVIVVDVEAVASTEHEFVTTAGGIDADTLPSVRRGLL